MDLMGIRRRLMMGQKKLVDTSPKIEKYGYELKAAKAGEIESENFCISALYDYPVQEYIQTIVMGYVGENIRLYLNGVAKDWWSLRSARYVEHFERTCINANTNQLALSIPIATISKCYLYLKETGQILFAGKDSPYYGYTNINDMP